MKKLIRGFTYSYHRNIGWQDKTLRTLLGIASLTAAIVFFKTNFTLAAVMGVIFIAQVVTVFSSRCIICFFAGVCTISSTEKSKLSKQGISTE